MATNHGWRTILPWRRVPKDLDEVPVDRVGCLSFLTISWLSGLMWRAFRRGLTHADIPKCPAAENVDTNISEIEALWHEEVEDRGSEARLSSVLLRYVRTRLIIACVILCVACVGVLAVVAYFMRSILFLVGGSELWRGVALIAGLFCVNMASTLLFVASFSIAQIGGAKIRSGVLGLLYKKLLRTSCIHDKTTGKIINLYANDGQRLMEGVGVFPMLVGGPLLGLGATGYAIYLLGVWALIGLGILILLFPLQMVAGKFFMKFRAKAITVTDQRVRQMTEYLSNMKFIKVYLWEEPLSHLIAKVRGVERRVLEKVNISMSFAFITASSVVSMATMITLIIYVVTGHELQSADAFIYIMLYSSIQERLELTTITVKELSEFFVACKRIQEILEMKEVRRKLVSPIQTPQSPTDYAVKLHQASFTWPQPVTEQKPGPSDNKQKKGKTFPSDPTQLVPLTSNSDQTHSNFTLHDITIKVDKGDVVGIVGPVGSGKSALLTALLGQMEQTAGVIQVHCSIAYVAQQAWVFNGTLRENITWGLPHQNTRYQQILDACCLRPDLDQLTSGDLTEIGERGINLSGGQRQRISLARAVYADRELYLLDDPLASVDPDVAESLFSGIIQDLLVGKTIFFVTSQVKYLQQCDHVVVLQSGRVVETGSPEELLDSDGYFTELCNQAAQPETELTPVPLSDFGISMDDLVGVGVDETLDETREDTIQVTDEEDDDAPDMSPLNNAHNNTATPGSLTRTEEKEVGAVTWGTYGGYVGAAGGVGAVLGVLTVSLLAEGARAFSYWWLGLWISVNHATPPPVTNSTQDVYHFSLPDTEDQVWVYHLIYALSLLAILVFFSLRCVILIKVLMRASSALHDVLFIKVLRCPMSFFDTTPMGQIINRFSRDMDEIDSRLPPLVDNTLKTIISISLYLLLIGILLPWFLVAVPLFSLLFLAFYAVFRVGTREMKRLHLLSMAPLLSHVGSTLEGLHSIRGYNKEEESFNKLSSLLDSTTARLILYQFSTRWINIRLAVVTTAILSLTSVLILVLRQQIPVEFAGTAVIYAVQLLAMFQFFVRFAVESEATFTSVQRIRSYITSLPKEAALKTTNFPLPDGWPNTGVIRFSDFSLRYRPGLPLVLTDLNIAIGAQHKVGIVGRTGSGKSSLATALFRLVEPAGGRIYIDNVDTQLVGLDDLRSQLSIIPQDPVLFSGTLRSNLDPFRRHIDDEIWRAMAKVNIKDMVKGLERQLDSPVAERGENFSVGERQLLCMARVLLSQTKILVLDEATAAIDSETERRIQRTLEEAFSDMTVLVIAHRLDTVMKCDKVLVMDTGRVLEYDTPEALLANTESKFHKMVMTTQDKRRESHSQAWV